MDAQELKRLKELAQAAPSGPYTFGSRYVAQPAHGAYYHMAQCPDGEEDTPEWERKAAFFAAANPAAVLELIALAERAVSSAESVQSIDTPEFRYLLSKGWDIVAEKNAPSFDALVAHIDAQLVKAREEGKQQAMDAIDAIDSVKPTIDVEALRQRAEAAEAKATQYDAMVDEEIKNRDYYHEMADKLAQVIAEYFDADIGEHSNVNCPWHEALRVIEEAEPRADQPLQQEGETGIRFKNNEPCRPTRKCAICAAYAAATPAQATPEGELLG